MRGMQWNLNAPLKHFKITATDTNSEGELIECAKRKREDKKKSQRALVTL